MSTEVLLMRDVKDLGREGDVVTVADGYARNYLLPGKMAAPVTAATRRQLAKLRRERETEEAKTLEAAKAFGQRLEGVSCTIAVKTGEDGKLYGSVTNATIAEALSAQGVVIDRHAILLDAPIKELGIYEVKIRLHADLEPSVKVWVVEE